MITPEEVVNVEIERLSSAMPLSGAQKEEIRRFLSDELAELLAFLQKNPGISRGELFQRLEIIHDSGRARIAAFLSSEQLAIWDSETSKAMERLSQKLAA